MSNQFSLYCDDDALSIIAKINQLLDDEGLDLELVDVTPKSVEDYMVYEIRSTVEDDR